LHNGRMGKMTSHKTSGLIGAAKVPGDKPISHRALICAGLARGDAKITNLFEGDDILRTADALAALGMGIARPETKGGAWNVRGLGDKRLKTPKSALYLGNSDTSARLLMGLVAGYPVSALLTGDASFSTKPMGKVIRPLAQMGARFESSAADCLPLRVIGSASLRPIEYILQEPSAQVKSAVLLAALHANGMTVFIEREGARDHTERMLASMGAKIHVETQEDGAVAIGIEGGARLRAHDILVPGDPFAAGLLTVAALITPESDVNIPNVLMNPRRCGLFESLKEMGANISLENPRHNGGEDSADIHVKSSALKGIAVSPARAATMVDEIPLLAVAAACADGKTMIPCAAEPMRANLAKGLSTAGVAITADENNLIVTGNGKPPKGGCHAASTADMRISAALLALGMASSEPIGIDNGADVNAVLPGIVHLLNGMGAKISE